jgi:ABC-2 type transport system ATP-binding protein
MATAEPVLDCRDLRRRYGQRLAVDGVGLRVDPGETYGLLGPNGAGKTTTISMICGLLRRDGGEVTVAGSSLDRDPGAVKAAIGYVPQDIALYPDLSGGENLRFWGRMQGLSGRELAARVEAVLELVGLADRARDKVADYSGGMQRRLNIGAGLLHRPRLLVLDEPTVGVDPQSRNAILENVEALEGEGVAVLYTTDYMEEAERLCDRVGIIDQGRLIAEGTRRELVAKLGQRDRIELAAAGDLVGRGDADAAFLIPAGFSASVQRGGSATITVLESGANPVAGQVARSVAEGYAAQVAATGLSVRTALDAAGRPPVPPGHPPGPLPTGGAARRGPGNPEGRGGPGGLEGVPRWDGTRWIGGPPDPPAGPLRSRPRPTGWPSGRPPPSRPCGWSASASAPARSSRPTTSGPRWRSSSCSSPSPSAPAACWSSAGRGRCAACWPRPRPPAR